MKHLKTQAIVLKSVNYADYDQILTVYTRELGKIKVMAKGVRRSKSKNRGGTQAFSLVQMELYRGKTFYRLIQSQNVKSFMEIRESYDKLLAASEWAEVLGALTNEEEPDPVLFTLGVSGFAYLAHQETVKTLLVFEARLLSYLGYLAAETSCDACSSQELLYVNDHGGCLCEQCHGQRSGTVLDKSALKTLCFFISEDLPQIQRLKVNDKVLQALSVFLHNRISAQLGRELRIFSWPDPSIDNI